ncbi:MAG: M4 family metallopeptidase [Acidobacteriota bacterium]|nr:M4 family metallopeptidase [Acidobacteriota bacterium]
MPARNLRTSFVTLTIASFIAGLPSAPHAAGAKKAPQSVAASGATSSPGPAPTSGAKIGAVNFPTYPLATAPSAVPKTGSRTPSDDPRSKTLAERLGQKLAAVRARQAVAATAADQQGALRKLRSRTGNGVEVRFRRSAGTPRFVRGNKLERRARSARPDPGADRSIARRFLRENRKLFALDDPDAELSLVREEKDRLGRTHVRFTQRYAGLEVWPAGLTIHLDPQGDVDLMNGAYVATPRGLGIEPQLSAEEAAQKARAHFEAATDTPISDPELIVYAPGDRPPRLGWRLAVHKSIRFDMLVVVDAEDGAILTSFNRTQTQNVVGSGVDLLGQTRTLNVWSENGLFYLTDTSKQMFDPASNPPRADTSRGAILIQDAVNQPPDNAEIPPNIAIVQSTSATSEWLADGVSAAFGLSKVYDYFLTAHGRDSLDGNGGNILAVVRFGQNYENAFFLPTLNLMAFGTAKPYAAALDIVGHELSHGVTSTTSDLIYRDQPGALNESMSDIFGEMVESFESGQAPDWLNGSVFPQPARSLSDPGSIEVFTGAGRVYPEKFSEFFGPNDPLLDQLQNRDNGGVHINSSIPNHAFYQLAAGLPGAIGTTDAAAIFYRANTVHLTQNSQFIDARLACIQSAEELFGAGSPQALRTAEAFDFVEIVDGEGSPDPPTFPGTPGEDATLFLFHDESGSVCGAQSGQLCLGREEFDAGDPAGGSLLSLYAVAPTRVSVSGDGTVAAFVDFLGDVCLIDTLSKAESCVGLPGVGISVYSVAISPGGEYIGTVLYDTEAQQPENLIRVLEIQTETSYDYELVAPALDGGALANVKFADALDFTSTGQFMMYDALSEISLSTGGTVGAWSIFAIDLFSGSTYALVPPFPGLDFGFPSLSHRSDNFMTFDVYDSGEDTSTIYSMNLNTGQTGAVGSTRGFGVPGYTGDDTTIIFSQDDTTSGLETPSGYSLIGQPIGSDSITPSGDPVLWLGDAEFGTIYRRGAYDPSPLAECEDGLDNDQNGLTDYPDDPGCDSTSDPVEQAVPEPAALLLQLAVLAALGVLGVRRRGAG